jgi:hypothetical protein
MTKELHYHNRSKEEIENQLHAHTVYQPIDSGYILSGLVSTNVQT